MFAMKNRNKGLLIATVFGLLVAACGPDSNSSQPGTDKDTQSEAESLERTILKLRATEADKTVDVDVDVVFGLGAGAVGPRIAEVVLSHSKGLKFVSCEKGDAVVAAQKELVVQAPEEGQVRTVIFASSNISELPDGTLMTCRFVREGGGAQTIDISTDKPIFAPAESNDGLLVGDPIVLE